MDPCAKPSGKFGAGEATARGLEAWMCEKRRVTRRCVSMVRLERVGRMPNWIRGRSVKPSTLVLVGSIPTPATDFGR